VFWALLVSCGAAKTLCKYTQHHARYGARLQNFGSLQWRIDRPGNRTARVFDLKLFDPWLKADRRRRRITAQHIPAPNKQVE
jgi:hypothetical protein